MDLARHAHAQPVDGHRAHRADAFDITYGRLRRRASARIRIEQGKSATQIVAQGSTSRATVAVVGDGEPDFRIGWSNLVTAGDFTLSTLIDWQQGSDIVNLTHLLYDFGNNSPDKTAAAAAGSRRSRTGLPPVHRGLARS